MSAELFIAPKSTGAATCGFEDIIPHHPSSPSCARDAGSISGTLAAVNQAFAQAPTQTFGYAFRAVLCPRCGAPLSAPATGGPAPCSGCGSGAQVAPRDERPLSQIEPAPPIPEPERIQRLRAQVGRPLTPPPTLIPLLQDGQLAPWKAQEAWAMWQALRNELAAAPRVDAAETFFFLTLLLAAVETASPRKRALVETALDLVPLKRHRQALRCLLARDAARAFDLASARAWLSPCDGRCDDIEADSEYRLAIAFVATAERRYAEVLGALGPGPHEIPIAMSKSVACAALRANAYEKQGSLDAAAAVLQAEIQAAGPGLVPVLERVAAMNRELDLCPQTLARLRSAQTSQAPRSASGGDHMVGLILGAILLAASAVMVLMGLLTTRDIVAGTSRFSQGWVAIGVAVPTAAAGVYFLAKALRTRRILLHGTDAQARVLSLAETGTRVNDLPVCELRLLVNLPGQQPYEAKAKRVLSHVEIAQLAHGGATVAVRVDPGDPTQVVLV
jgi:hypothetical protein